MNYTEYQSIKAESNRRAPQIVPVWLPDGKRQGNEWIARNPTRNDKTAGSFKINLSTGQWIDFASGDKGESIVSLAIYLHGDRSPYEAAENLARMMGFKS